MASTVFTAVAAAVIDTPGSGGNLAVGPTRDPVRRMNGRSFRAKFRSLKNRRFVRCESLLEMHAMQLLEIVRGVVGYSEQPPRLRLQMDAPLRSRQYTADVYVEWSHCAPWLVEVKPQELAQLDVWRSKFRAAAVAALRKGFEFVVLTERHMRAAGMLDVRRVLDERHRAYVERLGDGAESAGTFRANDHAEIEARVLKVLATAFEESPSRQLSRALGLPDAPSIFDGHRIGLPKYCLTDNARDFAGRWRLANEGGAS